MSTGKHKHDPLKSMVLLQMGDGKDFLKEMDLERGPLVCYMGRGSNPCWQKNGGNKVSEALNR